MDFIPEKLTTTQVDAPYFEDSKVEGIPGREATKPISFYQKQITDLLAKLGAGGVAFMPGKYSTRPLRYGFQIQFNLNGIPGRIDCAALPLRFETAKKKDRALAQALFLVRDWLQAEVYSTVYRPGAIPLVPYLIGSGGKTVTEALVESKMLPDIRPMYLPGPNGNNS